MNCSAVQSGKPAGEGGRTADSDSDSERAQVEDLHRLDSHFLLPPPGAPGTRGACSAAGAGGGGGGVGVWLQVGAPAPPAARVRRARRRDASYPEREGACRLRLRAAVWTPWVLGWGAPATVNTDCAAGACLRMLFLLSAQPWSTLAAGNTCEYSKSFKTYTVN